MKKLRYIPVMAGKKTSVYIKEADLRDMTAAGIGLREVIALGMERVRGTKNRAEKFQQLIAEFSGQVEFRFRAPDPEFVITCLPSQVAVFNTDTESREPWMKITQDNGAAHLVPLAALHSIEESQPE